MSGLKHDLGKLRWDLVPPEFEEVVKVLTFGANKYSGRNWEEGIDYGRIVGATQRHVWAFVRGETHDDETGLHHIAHAICELLFLLTYEERNMGDEWNDLPKGYGNDPKSISSKDIVVLADGSWGVDESTSPFDSARPTMAGGLGSN